MSNGKLPDCGHESSKARTRRGNKKGCLHPSLYAWYVRPFSWRYLKMLLRSDVVSLSALCKRHAPAVRSNATQMPRSGGRGFCRQGGKGNQPRRFRHPPPLGGSTQKSACDPEKTVERSGWRAAYVIGDEGGRLVDRARGRGRGRLGRRRGLGRGGRFGRLAGRGRRRGGVGHFRVRGLLGKVRPWSFVSSSVRGLRIGREGEGLFGNSVVREKFVFFSRRSTRLGGERLGWGREGPCGEGGNYRRAGLQ